MEKLIKILVLGLFALGFLYGQEKQIELKLPYKGKPGGEVAEIIYGETEMTVKEAKKLGIKGLENKNPDEKVKVKYPKVVVTKKAVKFLDIVGNQKKIIPLKEFEIVKYNQSYILIYGRWGLKNKPARISVLDHNGNIVWEKKGIITRGKSGIIHCELSNQGQVAVFYGDVTHSSYAELYDSKGDIIKEIRRGDTLNDVILKEMWPDAGGSVFLRNGELVVKSVTKEGNSILLCFKKDGNIKWIHKFPGFFIGASIKMLRMSGNLFLVYNHFLPDDNRRYVEVINENGKLLYKKELNELVNAPPSEFNIKILEIRESEESIKLTISYKGIVRKLNIKLGGK